MKYKTGFLSVLFMSIFVLATAAEKEEKWSWGGDASKAREISPVHSSDGSSSSADKTAVPKALPEGRTAGFLKKLSCKLGLCKQERNYQGAFPYAPQPIPLLPGPVPIGPPPIPVGPVPFPIAPVPIPIGSAPYPIAPQPIPFPQPDPYPVEHPLPSQGYPPIHKPEPVKTEHHHIHTHIHQGTNLVSAGSPYKNTGYPPKKTGFSPTFANGGSSHPGNFGTNNNGIGIKPLAGYPEAVTSPIYRPENVIKPIAGYPEAVTDTIYRPSKSLYREECQCVLPHQCQPYDIVTKSTGKDISYLLNPRTEGASILSNGSYEAPVRGKRDTIISNRQPASASSRTAKGRAIGGFTPGLSGCDHNYVCCRVNSREIPVTRGECGKRYQSAIHGRVANTDYDKGQTQFGEHPWQAAILKNDNDYQSVFVCGATLVSYQHVLTAAHCIVDIPYHNLQVRLGEWDVNSEVEFYKHVELPVQSVTVHPKYYAGNLENDIAVITLQGYIDFHSQPHIAPICLPNAYADFTHQHCSVTGWGKDAFGYEGEFQQILKEVDVPIIDRQSCQYALQEARLGRDYYLPEGFICAGGEEGKDTCKGDGGGPLACPTRYNTYELAGIVSWGLGCGQRGVPGVYVNIPYYVDWINAIINY